MFKLGPEHSPKLSYINLTEEEEQKEEQFGQIEALYVGVLSALSAGVVGMSR